jgi:acyl-CoA synthetase (AMP-forming)/AMP-acid ligase II
MNLMMLLEMAVSGFGDRVAVRSGAEELTYQQLFDAAGAAAAELEASGCENAALLDVNSLAVPVALFASAWAGRPFVPLNYRLADAEIEALAERIAPSSSCGAERADRARELPGPPCGAREPAARSARQRASRAGRWIPTRSPSCSSRAEPRVRRRRR